MSRVANCSVVLSQISRVAPSSPASPLGVQEKEKVAGSHAVSFRAPRGAPVAYESASHCADCVDVVTVKE